MILLNQKSVSEICVDIAQKVKQRRLELNLTQKGLALRADVNIETYRKFERIGEISLVNLVKIAIALIFDYVIICSYQARMNANLTLRYENNQNGNQTQIK